MVRMAIDYRQRNSITVFLAEPPCSMEDDLHKFSGPNCCSKLHLCKAYYLTTDRVKAMTAFLTHLGLMEFCRMAFGLVTACATYILCTYSLTSSSVSFLVRDQMAYAY